MGPASDDSFVAAAGALGLQVLEPDYLTDEREAHSLLPPWPLIAAVSAGPGQPEGSAGPLPNMLLGCFASEGDNVTQAMEVAQCSLGLLGLAALGPHVGGGLPSLRMPCSFAALYGRSSGMDVFLG